MEASSLRGPSQPVGGSGLGLGFGSITSIFAFALAWALAPLEFEPLTEAVILALPESLDDERTTTENRPNGPPRGSSSSSRPTSRRPCRLSH